MNLPKKLSDITLAQYVEVLPLLQKEYSNPVTRVIEFLCVLTGKPEKEVEALKVQDVLSNSDKIDSLFNDDPKKYPLKQQLKVNGKKYNIIIDATKLSASKYVTVMDLLKDCSTDLQMWEKAHLVLAALMVNNDNTDIDVNDYFEVAEGVKSLKMSQVAPISAFFFTLWSSLTRNIQDSLIHRAETQIEELRMDLVKSGAGS